MNKYVIAVIALLLIFAVLATNHTNREYSDPSGGYTAVRFDAAERTCHWTGYTCKDASHPSESSCRWLIKYDSEMDFIIKSDPDTYIYWGLCGNVGEPDWMNPTARAWGIRIEF